MMLRAVLIGAVVSLVLATVPPLRLGAWNVENFGTSKMMKQDVKHIIKAVIEQYDLMAILEVKDRKGGTAINDLLSLLNNGRNAGDIFEVKITPPPQDKPGIDQYAVFYRPSRINIVEVVTYMLTHPLYELVVKDMRNTGAMPGYFGMIVLHASPRKVPTELNNLAHESRSFMDIKNLPGVIIAGDLNAGPGPSGSYLYRDLLLQNNHLTDHDFKWLIDDDMNTNTKVGHKPYDRVIVLHEPGFQGRLREAKPYCFDRDLVLNSTLPNTSPCVPLPNNSPKKRLVKDVSDHYPVEVKVF